MTACPSTRSEVWGALANVLASYLSTPRQFSGPVIKVHPLPSGEAEWWIVAYGLMQNAKNTCITVFEAAAAAAAAAAEAKPVHRGGSTISTARTTQVSVFYIANS
jgi:hypothetical protein